MERKRHIKLVSGLSRAQEGGLKARGRKDMIPHITISSEMALPSEEDASRMMVGFSFFRRRGPAEALSAVHETK